MCGIAGYWDLKAATGAEALSRTVVRMTDGLVHRGPDAGDCWVDAGTGIALGHRRLSIIDLSPTGRQPMISHDGRLAIVFNGEIYNFEDLRDELAAAGCVFRGHSDTEVLLEACAAWGVERTLPRLNGLFAFALWDIKDQTLVLARDHLGIKPLYWSGTGNTVSFASELKALRAVTGTAPAIDLASLGTYLRLGYVSGEGTIYKGIQRLQPGHFVRVGRDGRQDIRCFWDFDRLSRELAGRDRVLSDTMAIDGLEAILKDAIRRQMVADVPLGAFLSGGYDSSTVVALMQAQSSRPVRTFTLGFDVPGFDEAIHAKAVAKHLGTEHTELYVRPDDALRVIPSLPDMFDEPFADSSQIPTFLVSELTRRSVTVALSGDGGDELFCGYTRYAEAMARWGRIDKIPGPLRAAGAALLQALPGAAFDWASAASRVPTSRSLEKARLLGCALSRSSFYEAMISHWPAPSRLTGCGAENVTSLNRAAGGFADYGEEMQHADTLSYLPDDILTKVDRASMAVSLEARVPLLDFRVVEYAWALPPHLKRRNGVGKWVLKQVAHRHVPQSLLERPKSGFSIPVGPWLRGPLRDWAEDLLNPDRMRSEGLLDPGPVQAVWKAHLDGRRDGSFPLWTILMFQAWRRRWL